MKLITACMASAGLLIARCLSIGAGAPRRRHRGEVAHGARRRPGRRVAIHVRSRRHRARPADRHGLQPDRGAGPRRARPRRRSRAARRRPRRPRRTRAAGERGASGRGARRHPSRRQRRGLRIARGRRGAHARARDTRPYSRACTTGIPRPRRSSTKRSPPSRPPTHAPAAHTRASRKRAPRSTPRRRPPRPRPLPSPTPRSRRPSTAWSRTESSIPGTLAAPAAGTAHRGGHGQLPARGAH